MNNEEHQRPSQSEANLNPRTALVVLSKITYDLRFWQHKNKAIYWNL